MRCQTGGMTVDGCPVHAGGEGGGGVGRRMAGGSVAVVVNIGIGMAGGSIIPCRLCVAARRSSVRDKGAGWKQGLSTRTKRAADQICLWI
jgi:hypothetical protein